MPIEALPFSKSVAELDLILNNGSASAGSAAEKDGRGLFKRTADTVRIYSNTLASQQNDPRPLSSIGPSVPIYSPGQFPPA
jgi:hypothetical protein